MLAHQYGLKTFYYSLINKAGSRVVEESHEVVKQEVFEEDGDCESCKL
jgi:hypothetical protein